MAKTPVGTSQGESAPAGIGQSGRGPRSPNFPAITLQDALDKAKILYEKDKRATVSVKTILKHFGFGENLSGSSARVISALRQFGLLDDVGENYRLSEAAYHILTLSENAAKRIESLQTCAQKPAIYRDVLKHYPDGLPSDDAVKDFLIADKKFNPASVDTFLRVFKASLAFAKLSGVGYTERNDTNVPKVGDYVQWESQGAWQLETPKQLLGISDDGQFAFLEGSDTGIPMEQLQKVDPPVGSKPPAPPIPPLQNPFKQPPAGVAREVSNLEKGEVVLQWPNELSAEEVDEIEDWLALVIKKMKRRYSAAAKE